MTKSRIIVLISLAALLGILIYFYRAGEQNNLSSFYEWTKEDPLFYSADMDISGVKQAVDKIEADQNKFLKLINEKEQIYPVDFLKSFVKTAQLTSDFLKNPTLDNANKLIYSQKETASLYKRDASGLYESISKRYPNSNLSVVDFNVQESVGGTQSDIKKIQKNADILISQINQREDCLKGAGKCIKPSDNFKKPSKNTISQPSVPKLLDKKLIFAANVAKFNEDQIKGPYGTQTPCFGLASDYSSPLQYFYVKDDPSKVTIQLATEMYFRQITPSSTSLEDQNFLSQGINYIYAPTSSPYSCNDKSYISQIYEIYLFLNENKPVLASLEADGKLDKNSLKYAEEFEKDYFASKYPTYEDAQVLADHYGYIYKLISQDSSLAARYKSVAQELLRRKTILNANLGGFSKILDYSSIFVQINSGLEKNQTDSNFKKFVYAFRNFYGIMYIPFSSAVYRGDSLSYIDNVLVKNAIVLDGHYMSYSQAKTKYSMDQILRWFPKRQLN